MSIFFRSWRDWHEPRKSQSKILTEKTVCAVDDPCLCVALGDESGNSGIDYLVDAFTDLTFMNKSVASGSTVTAKLFSVTKAVNRVFKVRMSKPYKPGS